MAAPGQGEDPLIHGLGAQLDGLNAVMFQAPQNHSVDGVRSGGEADGCELSGVEIGLRRGKQSLLLLLRNGGEASPIKRQLPLCPGGQGGCLFHRVCNCLGRGRLPLPGDAPLIAEDAVVGAAPVGHKNGDDALPGAHACSASRALQAAICSASFLLRPLPSPAGTPLMLTRKEKVLLWSGPLSPMSS